MAQMGYVGYGLYFIKGSLYILHPKGVEVYTKDNTLDHLLSDAIKASEEDNVYMDYKLNTRMNED